MPRNWLMKSEPGVYSIHDLRRDGRTGWEGVRNYQARNFLRDDAQPGDRVLFYHSNADPPGVAGLARIARAGYPDPTALDPDSDYFDPKASEADPRWYTVDVEFEEAFPATGAAGRPARHARAGEDARHQQEPPLRAARDGRGVRHRRPPGPRRQSCE